MDDQAKLVELVELVPAVLTPHLSDPCCMDGGCGRYGTPGTYLPYAGCFTIIDSSCTDMGHGFNFFISSEIIILQ